MKHLLTVSSALASIYLGYELFAPLDVTGTFDEAQYLLLRFRLLFDSLLVAGFGYLLVAYPERLRVGRRLGLVASLVVTSGLAGISLLFRILAETDFDWYSYSQYPANGGWSFAQLRNIALCLIAIGWLTSLRYEYHRKGSRNIAVPLRNAQWGVIIAFISWLLIVAGVIVDGAHAGVAASLGFAGLFFAGLQVRLIQRRAARCGEGEQAQGAGVSDRQSTLIKPSL